FHEPEPEAERRDAAYASNGRRMQEVFVRCYALLFATCCVRTRAFPQIDPLSPRQRNSQTKRRSRETGSCANEARGFRFVSRSALRAPDQSAGRAPIESKDEGYSNGKSGRR